jgi:threonine/homoserine/homoserine lactone efflux protein
MEIAFQGIKVGIVLTFLIGPVFFTIIQTSIERGFWNGVGVALGVSLSDTLSVTICYLGASQILYNADLQVYLAYGGGALIISFGLYNLLIKSRRVATSAHIDVSGKKYYRYFIKGFLLNTLTPMVILFWIGTISFATVQLGYTQRNEVLVFFGSVLVTVLCTDITKAYLAGKLRKLITPRLIKIINVVLGAALIVFGIRLILQGVQMH